MENNFPMLSILYLFGAYISEMILPILLISEVLSQNGTNMEFFKGLLIINIKQL